MVKPAHIHITRAPHRRKENELSTKPVSPSGAANATDEKPKRTIPIVQLIPDRNDVPEVFKAILVDIPQRPFDVDLEKQKIFEGKIITINQINM